MFSQARITMYDLMDQVEVVAQVWRDEDDYDSGEEIRRFTCTFRSTGETDRARWLRDGLIALAETL